MSNYSKKENKMHLYTIKRNFKPNNTMDIFKFINYGYEEIQIRVHKISRSIVFILKKLF